MRLAVGRAGCAHFDVEERGVREVGFVLSRTSGCVEMRYLSSLLGGLCTAGRASARAGTRCETVLGTFLPSVASAVGGFAHAPRTLGRIF